MSEGRYEPTSEFLRALINGEIALGDGEYAHANLANLIRMTRDPDPANRDWATMLLAQQEVNTQEVREALLAAAQDENEFVRAEAVLGLVSRDKEAALPFIRKELAAGSVAIPVLEAATIAADRSLVNDLRAFAEPSGDDYLDGLVFAALVACEA